MLILLYNLTTLIVEAWFCSSLTSNGSGENQTRKNNKERLDFHSPILRILCWFFFSFLGVGLWASLNWNRGITAFFSIISSNLLPACLSILSINMLTPDLVETCEMQSPVSVDS